MSVHPNDIARRSRGARIALTVIIATLGGAFFRAQVLEHNRYKLQSQENRLRPIPLSAPRGIIYDRKGEVIAENLPGYSVSIVAPSVDSLRAAMRQLATVITLTPKQIEDAVRRFKRDRNRPTVILSDASIDVISVLEEHRINFPRLLIQSVPKRFYPDDSIVAAFIGYTGEISDAELGTSQYEGYKSGQIIGKEGLEKQYEKVLRGREGVRYDEVDARGRIVREAGSRIDLTPEPAPPLYTNIDMDLQRYVAGVFGDSLMGGAIAIDPRDGGVLALYSAPSFNPNRFTGGIPVDYWRALNTDPRRPLYNKVIKGRYPPGSTFKLATATAALEDGLVTMDDHMPVPCTGGYQYGARYYRCWDKRGHGSVTLAGAIKVSCDTYFYQLGLKLTLTRLVAGGIKFDMRERTGIDLPGENRPIFPAPVEYKNSRFGARGYNSGETLNLAIGQGANAQTVVNMARFYTALATDGSAVTPSIRRRVPQRRPLFKLSPEQMNELRTALAGVVSAGGTAAGSHIEGIMLAGKTGTAQSGSNTPDHAWFVGFAPADQPTVVVAVMLEFGLHGSRAARIASSIVAHYLHVTPTAAIETGG